MLLMRDYIIKIFIWPYKVRKNTLYDDVYIIERHVIFHSLTHLHVIGFMKLIVRKYKF